MKVTIRYNTFETNSSSYHTVTITKKKVGLKPMILEEMDKIILDGNYRMDTIGSTGCYSTIAITNYEKANMILAIMGSYIEQYVDYKLDYSGTQEEKDRCALNSPYCQILIAAIKRRINKPVEIRFNGQYDFLDNTVYDEDNALDDFIGLPGPEDSDEFDISPCIDRMEELIFDESIDLKIDYETNE